MTNLCAWGCVILGRHNIKLRAMGAYRLGWSGAVCCVMAGGYIRVAKDVNQSEETCDDTEVKGEEGWNGVQ